MNIILRLFLAWLIGGLASGFVDLFMALAGFPVGREALSLIALALIVITFFLLPKKQKLKGE